ncbi:Ger(x)C family spore germination protein [Anaerobacillus sp. MEB173]|uniref:Ger(x)C family spore germination protein n=1 Tax=Anaerobacillus sp. MEB173 TaxID=3383345 RepID=UPI003F90B908
MLRKVLYVCLLAVLITGCVPDAREIDHRSIILGLAIDKGKEHQYSLTIQLPIVQGGGQQEATGARAKEFETFTVESDSLWDGLAQLEAYTPTVLFFGHLKVVQISEAVAREGLEKVIDFLDREPSVANQIFLVIVEKDRAEQFIEAESPLVSLPSLYLDLFFQADQKLARSGDVKLFEYRRDSNMISRASTIPLVKIEDDDRIVLENKAVFKDHRLIAKLVEKEAGMSHLLKDDRIDFMNYTVPIELEGEQIQVSLTRIELLQDLQYQKKTPLEIDLHITGTGEVVDLPSTDVNTRKDRIVIINEKMNEQIRADLLKTINKAKQLNVEPWLIGHRVWAMNPDYFEELDWEETGWRQSKINVTVDFKVTNTGQRGVYDKVKIGR